MVRLVSLLVLAASSAPGASGQLIDTLVVDGPPLWGDAPALVEELRVGTLMGDADEAFGSIGGVLALDDGSIWIGDRDLGAIRRFDSAGTYLGQLGREGEGPGEFKYPQGMRQLNNGDVAVWDDGQIRVSFFTPSGEFLRSFTPPTFMIGTPMEELELDQTTGDLLLMSGNMRTAAREDYRLFWLRLSAEGAVLDTIWVEPTEREGLSDPVATSTTVSPLGYRIVGRNDDFSLTLEVSPTRHTVLLRPWTAVRYQREERREKQRLAELFSERNGRPPGRVAETKPAFSRIQVDETGRIWVSVFTAGFPVEESEAARGQREEACKFFGASKDECDRGIRRWQEKAVFEVLGPAGDFYGRIQLPNRMSELVASRGNRLWVTETGSLGEHYVVRYRIAPN